MGSGFKTFTAGSVLTASDVQNYLQDQAVMVFGGTAARSSAIGTANFEEGMLTYLTDVDKLQVYTGSSFQDVYPPAATSQGMTLINTTSFSGVASQSINDVFSATYENYLILVNIDDNSAAAVSTFLRLRVSGTDNSSNNYYWCLAFVPFSGAANVTGSNGGGLTSRFSIGYANSGSGGSSYVYLANPFTNYKTRYFAPMGGNTTSDATLTRSGETSVTTSYTGFTIFPDSGTITGRVSVYGVNK